MEPKRQQEPVREKSFQDRERERIADEYDRRNKRGIYAECDDPDSDEFYLDPAEKAQLYQERLTEGQSFQDRMKAAREKIYGTPSPDPEESAFDDRPPAQAAIEDFRAAHPEISDKAWAEMNSPDFYLHAPDVPELQKEMLSSGSRAAMDKVLQRALDGYETFKVQQERRAAIQKAGLHRLSLR